MDNLIARQPIFDKNLDVFGYEIVSKSGLTNSYGSGDGNHASLSAIRNAFLLLGTKIVAGRKKIFLDLPRPLIVDGVALTLPSEITVINVVVGTEADETLVSACKALKEAHFSLSLEEEGIGGVDANQDMLACVDIIRKPLKPMPDTNDSTRIHHYRAAGKVVLAEGVETREDFEAARTQGYDLFLGTFFAKPSLIRSREIPGNKLNCLQVLQEVNRTELDFAELEKAIKQDTSLCYTLLNYVNSAYFGLDESIGSIRHALVLLGEKEVRKWANLILFTFMGFDKPSELIVTSLIRARFCETLGIEMDMEDRASELFLMGMFSMFDALMGRPMAEILDAIHLSREVEKALLYGSDVYGRIFQTVASYEIGNWGDFAQHAEELGIEETVVPDLYLQAVEWAETVSSHKENLAAS
jgi:c-di-GMP-related signal transduction protein